MSTHWQSLPYAFGGPLLSGVLRESNADFQVDEVLGFDLEGRGEHCCVHVRADGQNTTWVARALARWAGIPGGHVSFSGQKDRHAITTQWFSLHMPGKPDPSPSTFEGEGIEILDMQRHSRKLKRGSHHGNRFSIRLRQLRVAAPGEVADGPAREHIEALLSRVAAEGVPNYFGAQRFGRGESNLEAARVAVREQRLPRDPDRRSWILSALRSELFNLWLAARVDAGRWRRPVDGDLLQIQGRRGCFVPESIDDTIQQRLDCGELVLAGLLPGEGNPMVTGQALIDLQELWHDHAGTLALLGKQRMAIEPRAACLIPQEFRYEWENSDLRLEFVLPRGSFATAVVRELMRDRTEAADQDQPMADLCQATCRHPAGRTAGQ